MRQEHIPVLLKEVLEALNITPGKKYIDVTVGLGGHAFEIVKRGGIVLGVDRDPETIEKLKESRDQGIKEKLVLISGSFGDIAQIAKENGFEQIAGILFDLGYSSWQLDQSGRGFTYAKDESLDMRYDLKTQIITAADIVNTATKEELVDILSTFGEEEHADRIVTKLIRSRPLGTTNQLVISIKTAVRDEENRHTARVFQALRIAVNDELDELKKALPVAIDLLETGGRMAVISFHSLEDRIVKQVLKESEKVTIITKKPIVSTFEETKQNSRARSAKLRVAQKI